MKNIKIHRSIFSIILLGGLLFIFIFLSQCQTINEDSKHQLNLAKKSKTSAVQDSIVHEKQKGAHVFGIDDSTNYQPLIQSNLDWVTLVPWGFQNDYNDSIVAHHDGDSLRILQNDADWCHWIKSVRAAGFKVFFKPHLWVDSPSDGKWRSDIYPTNDKNWELWKKTYRNFIIRYAKIAEKSNAEMFCIGIEFSRLSVEKPEFWKSLIQEIRSIYSGKITYAANWYHEFDKITFWDDLDFIGIQAYFPLVKNENPSVEQISKGWKKHFPSMEATHKKYNRKILFTEMGYKSTADSAISPWEWVDDPYNQDKTFSPETQANCYEAFFNTVWEKEWFAGVHIWNLRSDYVEGSRKNNLDFTPQGKPATNIITKGFE